MAASSFKAQGSRFFVHQAITLQGPVLQDKTSAKCLNGIKKLWDNLVEEPSHKGC